MRYYKRSVNTEYKKTLKLLDVVAEKNVQYFTERLVTINNENISELLDPVTSVTFDQVVILKDKAIVQGTINKNIIYKDGGSDVEYFEEDPISFAIDVELPGLTPGIKIGKFNRLVIANNEIEIGSDNQGTNGGIDVQIYLTGLQVFQQIINNVTNTDISQKIVLDLIIKISKYTQQEIEFPAPQPVFECKNIRICNSERKSRYRRPCRRPFC
ncbi:MAG: DUF3794 domain-containing protein [Bacillota bacterium]